MSKVSFKFSKAHGSAEKGDVREMDISTARALKAHKVGTFKEDKKEEKPE